MLSKNPMKTWFCLKPISSIGLFLNFKLQPVLHSINPKNVPLSGFSFLFMHPSVHNVRLFIIHSYLLPCFCFIFIFLSLFLFLFLRYLYIKLYWDHFEMYYIFPPFLIRYYCLKILIFLIYICFLFLFSSVLFFKFEYICIYNYIYDANYI